MNIVRYEQQSKFQVYGGGKDGERKINKEMDVEQDEGWDVVEMQRRQHI